MRRLSFVLIVLAACGAEKPAADTTPEPPSSGPTCDAAGKNGAVQIQASSGSELSPEQLETLDALISDACTVDAWPPGAVRCVVETVGERIHECRGLIPAPSIERLSARIDQLLGGGSGGGDPEPEPLPPDDPEEPLPEEPYPEE